MIPFVEFGGAGPLLHLAHANGYPPGAYTPLIQRLTPHHRVLAMNARPLWPSASPADLRDWAPLTGDLIRFLDEQQAAGVVGVGHSLGGVCTLDAALQRPDLFSALVVIDPVIFRRRFLWATEALKAVGLLDRVHPLIAGTLRRRRLFADEEEMFARYRRAPIFHRINDRGLRAYVSSLARPRADGQVELAYPPEWEAAIYRTGPLNLWDRVGRLKTPTLIVYGAESDTFGAPARLRLEALAPHIRFVMVAAAGHLVPLERPEEVGRLILAFLHTLATGGRPFSFR